MKRLEEMESLTLYKERLMLPFNKANKSKGMLIYTINTSPEGIKMIFSNEHPKISNTGNYYHTYYYDYTVLPKSIQSNRVRQSGLLPSQAKKDRLSDYKLISDDLDNVKTPLAPKNINTIYDLNPLVRLYRKQDKLTKIPLKEKISTFLNTVNNIVKNPVSGLHGDTVFIDLDEYDAKNKFSELIYIIHILLRRNDKYIATLPSYNYKVLVYSKNGYFLVDMNKDLTRSNGVKLNKLIKKCNPSIQIDSDTLDGEKEEVQKYLAAKSMTRSFNGDTPDELAELDMDPDDVIDKDSEIVDDIIGNIGNVDKLDEPEVASNTDDELFSDEETKKKYVEALTKKATGRKQSEASIQRDKMLREKQKDIKIKTKTIGELSKEKDIPVIKPHKLDKLDSVVNENMKTLKFSEMNKTYMEEVYERDISNVITSLNDKTIPVNIINIDVVDTSDSLTLKETYTVTLEDANRKRHTLKFSLPIFVDNEFVYVNGSKKTIQNQILNYPVIKSAPDEVYICTNYNKIRIVREGTKFSKDSERLRKLIESKKGYITVHPWDNTIVNKSQLTFLEYDEFAKLYNTIEIGNATFLFNAKTLNDMFDKKSTLESYLVGYTTKGNKKEPIYYEPNGDYADLVELIVSYGSEEAQSEFRSYSVGKKYIHTNATIMAKKIPTIILICYFEGLTKVIQKFNTVTGKNNSVWTSDKRPGDGVMSIKFSDGYLCYKMSNTEACILFNGFTEITTGAFSLADMDETDTYLDIFEMLYGNSLSIADALINYYDFLIDPITLEILKLLDYPEDVVSLIIFANCMLADNHYSVDIDLNNCRIRQTEVVPTILYKNIAKAYSRYRRTANNPNPVKITMDEDAIIKELVALPTVEDYSELSPMVELHKQGLASMKGSNGINMDRAYKEDKRAYHDSMVGVIGISTDNGPNCGKIRHLTAEPTIINTRGFMELNNRTGDMSELKDVNLFTPEELLTPLTATHDDPNRVAMATKQTGHVIPVEANCPVLVSTGMDQVVHYRTGNGFSVVAKDDGKVIEVDEEAEKAIIQYKDGSKQAIDLSPHVVKNGGGGFYLVNQLSLKLSKNQTFKKDDIIAYDPKYYKEQGKLGNRLTMGTLTKVVIASNYSTYEDSTFVTKHMSKQMATNITMPSSIILGVNANVDYMVKVGDNVVIGDDLIHYESSYDDAELNKMLGNVRDDMKEEIINLGKSALHSHYTGVVSDIIIYCTVDPSELSPSLQKIVKSYQSKVRKAEALLDKYDPDNKGKAYRLGVMQTKSSGVTKADQYGKVKGESVDKGVLIEFYVTYHDELSDGDKLAAFTANKNTIGYVIPEGFEPRSTFRMYEEISSPVAPSAILQRGTPSVVVTGCANKVLIELKRQMYQILTGENFDEVLKQKQPWMVLDSVATKESLEDNIPMITAENVEILENAFDLYTDSNGHYRSTRYFSPTDTILPISNDLNMSGMLESFSIVEEDHNAILNDNLVCAIREISPNEEIRVKL